MPTCVFRRSPSWVLAGLCGLSILLTAGGIRGDEVTVGPAADCELRQQSPASNFGSAQTFVSGGLGTMSGGEARRALMRFSLEGLVPAGSTVTSVTLRVQVVRLPVTPVSSTFTLRRVLREWGETAASWNLRLSPDVAWEEPGVSGAGDREADASSSVEVSGIGAYTFPSTPEMVADVGRWIEDPGSNFGWLLTSEGEEELWTARHFASREDVGSAPVLTIGYTVPGPAVAPVMTGMRLVGEEFSFEFAMEEGRSYTVEWAGMTWPLEWMKMTNLTGVAGATNAMVTDAVTGAGRVYRVRSP